MEGEQHDHTDRDHAKDGLGDPDIEHLVEELRAYHAIYSPLFQRREQREAAYTYLQGLLAPLPRKSIEPMVLAVDGVAPKAVRAMQSFISEGQWNDERLLHQHWKEVEADLGADDGVLMVDGSDFPKQGGHSVGVKRQYCGELEAGQLPSRRVCGLCQSPGLHRAGSSVVCARRMAHG